MAKQTIDYANNLERLIHDQSQRFDPEAPDPVDPTVQLVLSFLQWNATIGQAEQAYANILNHMVDLNELRVSHLDEALPVIGEDYPQARNRLVRMKAALHEVYVREYSMTMGSILQAGKKDQRHYLDTLPGVRPYISAQVALLAFETHAMPVDEKLAALLQRENCLEPGVSIPKAETTICRHVKAGQAGQVHLALQYWSDGRKMPRAALADLEPAPVPEPEPQAGQAKATPTGSSTGSKRKKPGTRKSTGGKKSTGKKTSTSRISRKK